MVKDIEAGNFRSAYMCAGVRICLVEGSGDGAPTDAL